MPLQFLEINEEPVVRHPLRIQDPVEMIAFVLNNPGMKTLDLALDHLAVQTRPAVAHPQMPRHDPTQPGNRETPFPSECALSTDGFDDRIDQHRQILRDITGHVAKAFLGYPEDDD